MLYRCAIKARIGPTGRFSTKINAIILLCAKILLGRSQRGGYNTA